MELIVNMDVVNDAKDRMLSMDEYVYLFYGVQGVELDLRVNMPKLVRSGYLDKDMCFTEMCYEIVPEMEQSPIHRFEEFWELYPLNDEVYNFVKSRTLRVNKSGTKKEYMKQSKLHGEDFIIDCLQAEIEDRMENSLKKNAFTYMKSSLNYLKEQAFLQYGS